MDSIVRALHPCTTLTPIPHTQMSSRSSHPDSSPRSFVERYSAQQASIPFSDLPCQGIPARPTCCWQSTLQAWWAATGGQAGACCRRTGATSASGVAGTCAAPVAGAADTLHGFRRSRSSFTEPLRLLLVLCTSDN